MFSIGQEAERGFDGESVIGGNGAESVLTHGHSAGRLPAETAPRSTITQIHEAPTRSSAWSWPGSSSGSVVIDVSTGQLAPARRHVGLLGGSAQSFLTGHPGRLADQVPASRSALMNTWPFGVPMPVMVSYPGKVTWPV